jgi:2-dehydro-3-deoxyphosphogluconate aldolase/(4S)-4-hydroxy-2-oxoglutarate aldolase
MELHSQRIDQVLARAPIVPVLSITRVEDAVPLARALVAGGLPVLEVTLRTEAAIGAIRAIREEVPNASVGAGTVLNARHLSAVEAAGATFAISPGSTDALYAAASDARIPLLPGIATASELMHGLELGYERFKFFPAESSGGIAALKSFAGPFAQAKFCPTGGVSLANARDYLALPNVRCVGGSWVAPTNLVKAGAWAQITDLARAASALR